MWKDIEERNAVVKSTQLGYSSCNGLMSAFIHVDYGGAGQGFGGYVLDGVAEKRVGSKRSPEKYCGAFIAGVLRVLEVDDWEKLAGTSLRVRGDDGKIFAIGHYLKDQWYSPKEDFEAIRKQEAEGRIAGGSYERAQVCIDACVCISTEALKRVRIDNIGTALVQIYEIASDPTIYEEEACKVISKQARELLVNLERTGFKSHSNKTKGGDDE